MVFDTKKSLPGGSVPPLSETAFLPLSLGFFVFFVFVFVCLFRRKQICTKILWLQGRLRDTLELGVVKLLEK